MIQLPEMPASIGVLPRDERGYPVPWFVAWVEGKPEFRAMDGRKWSAAIRDKLCWICGTPLNPKQHVFVIGPMCAVNKTSSEPPCHEECAVFSAKACPFLSKPKAVRREANMPEGSCEPAGFGIDRNPGVTLLWYCKGYEVFDDGRGGKLIGLPNPSQVRWWREGRTATREEIMESINTGLPILRSVAEKEGRSALQELQWATDRALKFVPKS